MQILTPYLPHDDRPTGQLLCDGKRIYAIGDIHGRLDCLEAMFNAIEMDKLDHPVADVQEIYLGDYVDRGPQSREVIERLIRRQKTHGAICLAGNHDLALQAAIEGGDNRTPFILMGGQETCESYGVEKHQQNEEMIVHLKARFPLSHFEFLASLKDSFTVDDIMFAHAGINPNVALDQQSLDDLAHIRGPFLNDEGWHGKLIIHGHTMASRADIRPNRIGIDTGAFMTGVLTAIVLETEGFRFLSTQEKPDTRFGRLKQ
jgi:serine/threonine protein phosphatase 1